MGADHFADSLRNMPSDTAPTLAQALQPTRAHLQETLRDDLSHWCGSAMAGCFRTVVHERSFPHVRSAIESAMREVSAQSTKGLDKVLADARTAADVSRLSEKCSNTVAAAVRHEVHQWEERMQQTSKLPSAATTSILSDQGSVSRRFAQRLASVLAPVQRDLDMVARDLEQAKYLVDGCKTMLATAEATKAADSSFGISGSRAEPIGNFASQRALVYAAIDDRRLRDAFEVALTWEAQNQTSSTSLLELALARFYESFGEASTVEPEDVASQLDGRLQLLLMSTLLQRSVVATAAPPVIERNLEWVFALLQAMDVTQVSMAAGLENARPRMVTALEKLHQAQGPRALMEADSGQKRRIASAARLALKSLNNLVQLSLRS